MNLMLCIAFHRFLRRRVLMKRINRWVLAGTACLLAGGAAAIGDNRVTAYGTYWNGDKNGYGLGLKYSKALMDMVYIEGRGGYVSFDDALDTTVVPVEAGFNFGLPGTITPYVGVGLGYYIIDNPFIDSTSGFFAQAGVEFTISRIGLVAELRYHDLGEQYLDGVSLNGGVILRF
jgi:hypothetical protein